MTSAPYFRAALAFTSFVFALGPSQAQETYPSAPVHIVVPTPPGTVLDTIPRLLAGKLVTRWRSPVIVENRPGGAQNIAAEHVARSAPDGHTLFASPPGPLVVSQWYYKRLPFDPTTFVVVSVLASFPTVIVAHPSLPAGDFAQLLEYAKANPDKLTFGSPGTGSTPHLAMEEIMRTAKVKLRHVPYQGMAPAGKDLLAGHIDIMIDLLGNVLPLIKDHRLKVLAVTGESRLPSLPEVKTVGDSIAGFNHSEWFAVVAPPNTSAAIASKISQALAQALALPDIAKRLGDMEAKPIGSSPKDAAAFVKSERERWRKLIEATGQREP